VAEQDEREQKMLERQDGDYTPPILTEPAGGPVPEWAPEPDDQD
jgi:hypothetical protein